MTDRGIVFRKHAPKATVVATDVAEVIAALNGLDTTAPTWPITKVAIHAAYNLGFQHAIRSMPKLTPTEPTERITPHTNAAANRALVLGLLERKEGATLQQIADVTGYKLISVSSHLSVLKNTGITISATKTKGKPTIYRIGD